MQCNIVGLRPVVSGLHLIPDIFGMLVECQPRILGLLTVVIGKVVPFFFVKQY